MEFSISKMKEFIKTQTEKRVSKEAAKELNDDLEGRGLEIGEKAVEIAENKGRVTVRAEDIREALES
ncbi:MAG: histone [Candidatus Nanohaloarchaea archaeon]